MDLFEELKENFEGEGWEQQYEELVIKYNDLVDKAEKRLERSKELLELLHIFEEELLKYKTESDYQEFLGKIELEHNIPLPKILNKRLEQKETVQEKQGKPQFSIAGLRQRQQEIDNKNQPIKIKKKSR